VAGDWKRLHFY